MGTAKEAGYAVERPGDEDAPPAYDFGGPSSAAGPTASPPTESGPSTVTPSVSLRAEKSGQPIGPTVDAPFNFPAEGHPPPYSPSGSSKNRPIAIPQANPSAATPFLPLYPPSLLNYGITPGTWASFLDTLSAFLTAKVSDRAISHAADMGRRFTEAPKGHMNRVVSHAKDVGKNISSNAKRGNIIGAAMGVIGGSVSITVSAALGVAGAAVQLPGSTLSAVSKKPQTPRERAVAYLAVANKDWFTSRGLQAYLMDSKQLSEHVGVDIVSLAEAARDDSDRSVERQFGSLQEHIEDVDVTGPGVLVLGSATLWLVLIKVPAQDS